MEIVSFEPDPSRVIEAHGSKGVTARKMVAAESVHVTVLRVEAGGEIGTHPTPGDQMLMVTAGSGAVRSGDGPWEDVRTGQAVVWRAGEVHTTRATESITAVIGEMPDLPLRA